MLVAGGDFFADHLNGSLAGNASACRAAHTVADNSPNYAAGKLSRSERILIVFSDFSLVCLCNNFHIFPRKLRKFRIELTALLFYEAEAGRTKHLYQNRASALP